MTRGTETHFKLNNKKNMQKQKLNTGRPEAPNGRKQRGV